MARTATLSTDGHLRALIDDILAARDHIPQPAIDAFQRLTDVLEPGRDAVIFPADQFISTEQAASLLGVRRMTVVRLIDRGILVADTAPVHRRISVSELARYEGESKARRANALKVLAQDITDDLPADEVISTR